MKWFALLTLLFGLALSSAACAEHHCETHQIQVHEPCCSLLPVEVTQVQLGQTINTPIVDSTPAPLRLPVRAPLRPPKIG